MLKRLLDIVVSILALMLLAPLLAVVALLVRTKLGTPVLFTQMRPGLRGEPFRMVKFRSMTDALDADGCLLPDAERLTDFGRWLRATSLDELPEIWNILKGDMSWVGPRPLLMSYLPLYNERQRHRHDVRPGMTGWAQINGRNAITWEEKFELDVWYVNHQSFWLDFRIFCETFTKVVRRHDVSQPGQATMSAFRGSPASISAASKNDVGGSAH